MESVWTNQLREYGPCERCPGSGPWTPGNESAPYPLGGLGDPSADLMLVGQDPAYDVEHDRVRVWREERGLELTWEEGKKQLEEDRKHAENDLWELLEAVREVVESIYYTNLVKCGGDDGTWPDRRDCCVKGYFWDELELVDPEVVILFGSKVCKRVLPKYDYDFTTLGDDEGKEICCGGRTMVPCYHWSARGGLFPGRGTLTDKIKELMEIGVCEQVAADTPDLSIS